MTAEQETAWKAMQARFSAVTRQLDRLQAEILVLLNQERDLANQVAALEEAKALAVGESSCMVGGVTGDTIVRTARVASQGFPLEHLSPKDLHQFLRSHGLPRDRLFSASTGSLSWTGRDLKAQEP